MILELCYFHIKALSGIDIFFLNSYRYILSLVFCEVLIFLSFKIVLICFLLSSLIHDSGACEPLTSFTQIFIKQGVLQFCV